MQFTCGIKDLKARGYKFSKMYARNYHVYFKDFNSHRIWCWVAGRSIEIEDWFGETENILNFYKANKDTCVRKYGQNIILDYDTHAIRWLTGEEDFALDSGDREVREKFYDNKRKIFLSKDFMEQVIKEVEYLTS